MWRVHGGDIVFANDLLVINLRAADTEATGPPLTHLSVFDVAYSAATGSGRIAFLRLLGAADPRLGRGVMLTDNPALVPWFRERLASAQWSVVDLGAPPIEARFQRGRLTDRLGLRIEADDILVQASWEGLSGPRWVEGPLVNYPLEYTWALLLEAVDASVTVNGTPGAGEPYADERFQATIGRPISSCNVGLCEVHLKRGASRAR